MIAVALFLWGAQRIIRSELRYRRWFLARCAECGYALGGIRGDRCPECGTQWWPYGDAE